VAALPGPQRRLIELHFYEEVPVAQAAAALGVSRHRAFERQRMALRMLRSALALTFPSGGTT